LSEPKAEIYRIFMAGGMWRWAETLAGHGIWDREEADAKARGDGERMATDGGEPQKQHSRWTGEPLGEAAAVEQSAGISQSH
jgi:hypothetical protein